MIQRNTIKITYSNGLTIVFDPLVRWLFSKQTIEVGLRGGYAIGVHNRFTIGTFSRYKTRFFQLGRFAFYAHLGETAPHNPRTEKYFA